MNYAFNVLPNTFVNVLPNTFVLPTAFLFFYLCLFNRLLIPNFFQYSFLDY